MKANRTGLKLSMVVFLMSIHGCAAEPTQTTRKSGKNPASGNAEGTPQQTSTPVPSVPQPQDQPVGSLDQAACEQKWNQYVAFLKPNTKLEYDGTVLIGLSSFPIKHNETIVSSTDASVVRKVEFTSINATARLLLTNYKIPTEVTVTKQKYVKACMTPTSGDKPLSPLLQDQVQLIESKMETVSLQGKQQETQFLKLEGNYSASGMLHFKTTASLWISTKAPGVVLKQVAELKNIGNDQQMWLSALAPITISDELISPVIQ